MHLHILGIGGTFMGGVAALAKQAGYRVSGCDKAIYPPMSTQLKQLDIDVHEGFDAEQLSVNPDCVVVGNVMRRGMNVIEHMLNGRLNYQSGPAWLGQNVLRNRHVFAVAGTHGKTTTASMLAWILEDAGLEPGFLIGGIPVNFGTSARLGGSDYFVVEADEYDTAFFDKRAKFVHYSPSTVVLNNLEYDHADIYKDIDAILWQFHQLLRIVPGQGRLIVNAADANLRRLLAMGCWTPVETFAANADADWRGSFLDATERRIQISGPEGEGECRWQLGGQHNLENVLAAIAAAQSAGVSIERAVAAMSRFEGVKRRLERTATVANIAIYDDFAHHPTAIKLTIAGVRKRVPGARIVVALEPRSNTMKLGVHNRTLAAALSDADLVYLYRPQEMDADFDESLKPIAGKLHVFDDYDKLVSELSQQLISGDQVIFMSNGGFGSARQTLTALLQRMRSR